MSVLHYAEKSFTINETANLTWQSLADKIEAAVRDGGGFVDIPTTSGVMCVLFTSSIPAWFAVGEPAQRTAPRRLR